MDFWFSMSELHRIVIGRLCRFSLGSTHGEVLQSNTFHPINAYLQIDQCSVCLLVPEGQRVHGIIECVVSPNKMTSTPSKIISSSINNLTVWYGESGPISDGLPLFGYPCLYRIPHNYRPYNNKNASSPLILLLLDCDSFCVGQKT
jgi:hypothetical protein